MFYQVKRAPARLLLITRTLPPFYKAATIRSLFSDWLRLQQKTNQSLRETFEFFFL